MRIFTGCCVWAHPQRRFVQCNHFLITGQNFKQTRSKQTNPNTLWVEYIFIQTICNLCFLQAGKARSSAEAEKKGMVRLKCFRRLVRFVVIRSAWLVASAIVYEYGHSFDMPTLLQACESSLTYGEIQFHSFATAISKIRC